VTSIRAGGQGDSEWRKKKKPRNSGEHVKSNDGKPDWEQAQPSGRTSTKLGGGNQARSGECEINGKNPKKGLRRREKEGEEMSIEKKILECQGEEKRWGQIGQVK